MSDVRIARGPRGHASRTAERGAIEIFVRAQTDEQQATCIAAARGVYRMKKKRCARFTLKLAVTHRPLDSANRLFSPSARDARLICEDTHGDGFVGSRFWNFRRHPDG